MLGIQTDRTYSARQIDTSQAPADSNSEMKYPVVEGQLSIAVNDIGTADLDLDPRDEVLPLSATTHRGPPFTDFAPDPVLAALLQYAGSDDLRTMAGDPALTAGMQHLPGFNAVAQAVGGLQDAEHEFDTAQLEKADDPSNVHAFDNARLRAAYNQHVANTHRLPPAVKSAIANGASAVTKVVAGGFTYAAAIEPAESRVGMGVIAGLNWLNAGMVNLAACTYRRTAATQRDLDMRTAVSLDLDRLGTNVTTANALVAITLDDLRAMDRSEQSSSSSLVTHVNDDEEPQVNPQS